MWIEVNIRVPKQSLKWLDYKNCYLFTTLIDSFCKAKMFGEAKDMFLEMPRFGVAPTVHVHISLMVGAFRSGNAQEALTLYQEMTRLGLCPDGFLCSIVVRQIRFLEQKPIHRLWNILVTDSVINIVDHSVTCVVQPL
jgi:pentatricopeptide repeat protein